MHVLVTADTLSGVWPYTRELVTGLTQRGVRVTLVSMGEIPSTDQTEWMDGLRGLDFRPTAFRVEWMRDAESDLDAANRYLAEVVAEVQPDLLHLSQYHQVAAPVGLPKVLAVHGDVLTWWQCVHESRPKADDLWIAWYRDMVRSGINQATALVAPSQWMLTALRGLYGAPGLGTVIYPGRSPAYFHPHMSKELIALSVGRIWDFGKNSALLARFESPIPMYLVSSDTAPEHPANQNVFPPRQRLHLKTIQTEKQMRLLYGKAAIYVTTAQYEPFGTSPLEAALSRCALVASDIPTHREVWGEAALYFSSNDPESLCAALFELSQDRDLCATYGKLAFDRARNRYSAARMVDDYLHLYNALAPATAVAA